MVFCVVGLRDGANESCGLGTLRVVYLAFTFGILMRGLLGVCCLKSVCSPSIPA